MATADKAPDAFRTIGELSAQLGVAQHILRYWETKFPQLKPLQRAGNRRYYRPAEVALARRIHHLLSHQGYTVRGVQKLLADRSAAASTLDLTDVTPPPPAPSAPVTAAPSLDVERLTALRDRLAEALTA
ncbi:MerR family transcriptional regulator [Sphingomonas sp.]|uniref:MerR family transcriptional regulator n=1 Tax=Sphingomonas sp. TaxID=28214 RepID=UPI0025E23B2A|nr:MerR family transcriptional regulator [Sphingomonas sp.]